MGARFRLAAASAVAVIAALEAASAQQGASVVLPEVTVSATGIATPLDQVGSSVTVITAADIANAVDTAGKIGDDWIQAHLGGRNPDPSQYTHGTAAQRAAIEGQ